MLLGWFAVGLGLRGAVIKFPFPEKPSRLVPPNVVWIIANDLGPGDLGCYGQTNIATPNIDRLARDGTVFTQCYASSPDNLISRAGLLTSRDPRHLDLLTNSPVYIEPGIPTIGQAMKSQGYTNAYFGKWLLGEANHYSQPQRKGFEEWFGELRPQTRTDFYPDKMWRHDPVRRYEGEMEFAFNLVGRRGVYLNDFFLRATTNVVRINYPHMFNRWVPFFTVAAFALPNPLDEWAGNTNRFSAVPELGRYAVRDWPMSEKQKAAAVGRLDFCVGELFKVLERYRQVTNTVIVLTSDGGPFEQGGSDPAFFNSAQGRRGSHGDLTEGGIRVPLIVHCPGRIPGRSTNDLLCSLLDLMPTTIELAGAEPPDAMDGISFLPSLLRREQTNRHELLVWSTTNRHAVRFENWKAIQTTNQTWELYDLGADPPEATNLAAAKPMVLQSMIGKLKEWFVPAVTR